MRSTSTVTNSDQPGLADRSDLICNLLVFMLRLLGDQARNYHIERIHIEPAHKDQFIIRESASHQPSGIARDKLKILFSLFSIKTREIRVQVEKTDNTVGQTNSLSQTPITIEEEPSETGTSSLKHAKEPNKEDPAHLALVTTLKKGIETTLNINSAAGLQPQVNKPKPTVKNEVKEVHAFYIAEVNEALVNRIITKLNINASQEENFGIKKPTMADDITWSNLPENIKRHWDQFNSHMQRYLLNCAKLDVAGVLPGSTIRSFPYAVCPSTETFLSQSTTKEKCYYYDLKDLIENNKIIIDPTSNKGIALRELTVAYTAFLSLSNEHRKLLFLGISESDEPSPFPPALCLSKQGPVNVIQEKRLQKTVKRKPRSSLSATQLKLQLPQLKETFLPQNFPEHQPVAPQTEQPFFYQPVVSEQLAIDEQAQKTPQTPGPQQTPQQQTLKEKNIQNNLYLIPKKENIIPALELKMSLIYALKAYTEKIEAQQITSPGQEKPQPNFSYGFWVMRDFRTKGRKANYFLAQNLIEKLKNTPVDNNFYHALEEIFSNQKIYEERDYLLREEKNNAFAHQIHSKALNEVIEIAQQFIKKNITSHITLGNK